MSHLLLLLSILYHTINIFLFCNTEIPKFLHLITISTVVATSLLACGLHNQEAIRPMDVQVLKVECNCFTTIISYSYVLPDQITVILNIMQLLQLINRILLQLITLCTCMSHAGLGQQLAVRSPAPANVQCSIPD